MPDCHNFIGEKVSELITQFFSTAAGWIVFLRRKVQQTVFSINKPLESDLISQIKSEAKRSNSSQLTSLAYEPYYTDLRIVGYLLSLILQIQTCANAFIVDDAYVFLRQFPH